MTAFRKPSYVDLLATGELAERARIAHQSLAECHVCPLSCGVNRLEGKQGVCRTGLLAQVSCYGPHHGEEKPLRGWRGSGTIFFSCCNLRCVFCQNADISQEGSGNEVTSEELAAIMLSLQRLGCHNINLVSPSHVVPQILEAVLIAAQADLYLPLVYNTGGYDSLEMLDLLDGVIDIYMPDMKYADEAIARKYSRVPNYPAVNQAAVRGMQRQVGNLEFDAQGIATRGLLVRHLIMPNNLAGTEQIIHFLSEEISRNVYLNLMDQYRPSYQAVRYPEINRCICRAEFDKAVETAKQWGLWRFAGNEPAKEVQY